jgi:hypothetical protein
MRNPDAVISVCSCADFNAKGEDAKTQSDKANSLGADLRVLLQNIFTTGDWITFLGVCPSHGGKNFHFPVYDPTV